MVTVTDTAKDKLKETLLSHSEGPETGLRLTLSAPGQLGIVLDNETEGDQVVEHQGSKVLLVSSEVAPTVDGLTLDVRDTPEGQSLVVVKEQQESNGLAQ